MLLQLQTQHNEHRQQNAFSRFLYGIKSDETRRSYVSKLEFFFDFYKIEGNDIKEKSENFLEYTKKGKNITQKVTDLVLNYMYFHIQRAQKKEISRGTIRNFYKPIKLFCEMNNVVLNWKIISKGYLAIDPKYYRLITSLRTAYAEELNLKKDIGSYSDLLDALRLSLKGYSIE